MNIQQIKYIIALDSLRNYARAAEACDVSQPTLSAMVQKLEEEELNHEALIEELYTTFIEKGYTAEDFYGDCALCGDANDFVLDIIDAAVLKTYPDITKEDLNRLTNKLYTLLHKRLS